MSTLFLNQQPFMALKAVSHLHSPHIITHCCFDPSTEVLGSKQHFNTCLYCSMPNTWHCKNSEMPSTRPQISSKHAKLQKTLKPPQKVPQHLSAIWSLTSSTSQMTWMMIWMKTPPSPNMATTTQWSSTIHGKSNKLSRQVHGLHSGV